MAAQGHGAGIRDILISELEPYELSRVSMTGQDVFLPPRLALTMALLTHELTTNTAKYGALSKYDRESIDLLVGSGRDMGSGMAGKRRTARRPIADLDCDFSPGY